MPCQSRSRLLADGQKKLRVAALSHLRAALFFVCLLIRLGIAVVLGIYGAKFLIVTVSVGVLLQQSPICRLASRTSTSP